ncbi:MAG TPA: thiamine phosphate synthase [Candidatus Tripitaka californicus]|uniref:thiamine phosphate synthase n=1 Tax=Candidatus Tripitaka californicus TaxID=3367616 RepID=UPI0040298EDD|nr:thiamine phosphate synthase [Planctomycetota bacterium]
MDHLKRLRLILITDRNASRLPLIRAVGLALGGNADGDRGVTAVQLRERDLESKDLFSLARELRELTSQHGAALIINDRVDIALAVGAEGVHIGSHSMPLGTVRRLIDLSVSGRGGVTPPLLGFSAHNMKEALEAEEGGADYITLSPVFTTHSKKGDIPIGSGTILQVKERVGIPVIALGGINKETAAEALENKADGLAVISAIIAHRDPKIHAQDLRRTVDYWFSQNGLK